MHISTKHLVRGLLAFLLLAGALLIPTKALAVTSQSIAAPLFAKPGSNTFWDDVRNAGSGSVSFVIANPSNGPGVKADPVYTTAIAKNTAASVRTLGYVQTNFQQRPYRATSADIDNWYKLYPQTRGIYVDSVREGGPEEACYVAALYTHVKNVHPNDLVVLAPGGHISPTYEPYGDIFVNASSDYATYTSWKVQYKSFEDRPDYQNRFWHMIYGVTSDNYSSALTATRANNAGWIFMTDQTAPTPFDATPSFWQNESTDINTLPATAIPNRGMTSLPRGCISLSSSADSTIDTTAATAAKQSSTVSAVRVNNVSTDYDAEPTTTAQVIGLPNGATLTGLSGAGWTCTLGTKTCTYAASIPVSSSTPTVITSLQTTCDFGGGDGTLRLTNYAGNRWDLRLPLKPPFGCASTTPAGKVNSDTSGQIMTLTTQSTETTPGITPLKGSTVPNSSPKSVDTTKHMSVLATVLIVVGVLAFLGLVAWGLWLRHKHARYRVNL